jgi:DNA sulfur modification protein DndC
MSKSPKIFKKIQMKLIEADIETFINSEKPDIKGFTAPILLKHKKVLSELMFLYLNDEAKRPLSVAYSGGKDSTVCLDITLKALMLIKYIYGTKKLAKKTYVLFSDTLMELDPVINGIISSLNEVKHFCEKHQLNVDVKKVSPELKNRWWSLIIGKGYILPTPSGNRYCSERMKILPQKAEIENILKENMQGFIAITGQRRDEAESRKERLKIQTIDGSFKQHDYKGCSLYTPIEYFNSNQVWDYIYTASFDWVDQNYLGKIYAEASGDGDECRSLLMGYEAETPGCGKSSRFGCWCCSIHLSKDKTLNNLGKKTPYLQKMEEFRNWLVKDATGEWSWKRDYYIHGKHKMKRYDIDNHRKNMWLPGGYSLYYRMQILTRLALLEQEVYPERQKYLISDEELGYIQEIWIEDGDINMTVQKICKHRNVQISEKHRKAVEAAKVMQSIKSTITHNDEEFYIGDWVIIEGLNKNACARYYTQMALQVEDKGYDSKLVLEGLRFGEDEICIPLLAFVRTLPVQNGSMNFLSQTEENYVRDEWKRGKLSFVTFLDMYKKNEIKKPQQNLLGYDGDYGTHFEALELLESGADIIDIDNDLISLHDKMKFFDTWN